MIIIRAKEIASETITMINLLNWIVGSDFDAILEGGNPQLTPATFTLLNSAIPSSGGSSILSHMSNVFSLPLHVTLVSWIVRFGLP